MGSTFQNDPKCSNIWLWSGALVALESTFWLAWKVIITLAWAHPHTHKHITECTEDRCFVCVKSIRQLHVSHWRLILFVHCVCTACCDVKPMMHREENHNTAGRMSGKSRRERIVDMNTGHTHGCYIAVNQKSIRECEMLVCVIVAYLLHLPDCIPHSSPGLSMCHVTRITASRFVFFKYSTRETIAFSFVFANWNQCLELISQLEDHFFQDLLGQEVLLLKVFSWGYKR